MARFANAAAFVFVPVIILSASLAQAVAVSGKGTWESTLMARDFDGDASTIEGYYDTGLGITWLADANYAQTSGYARDGVLRWADADAWAADLNLNGITHWRLPNTEPVDGTAYDYGSVMDGSKDVGFNISAPGSAYPGSAGSEMARMFYSTLGNLSYYDTSGNPNQPGWQVFNRGPFENLLSNYYWSATEYAPLTSHAWFFYMDNGYQYHAGNTNRRYVWVVHDGDVGAPVPVPAALGLFASAVAVFGLLGRPEVTA